MTSITAILLIIAVLQWLLDAASLRGRQWAAPFAVCVAAGWWADQVALEAAVRWIREPLVWVSILVAQAAIAFAPWTAVRRLPAPLFGLAAIAGSLALLQTPWFSNGLAAGAAMGTVWVLAGVTLGRLLPAWPSLSTAAHLSALLLIPSPNDMNSIHDILYVLSSAFLMPTLVGTLAAFGYGVWVTARFLADFAEQRETCAVVESFLRGETSLERFATLRLRGDWRTFQDAVRTLPSAQLGLALAGIENTMHARLDRLGIMAKTGPMLGLIGTLIPLQPALAGLAKGDMQAMGANLQIGFTTTVLGLLTGGVCYAISVYRKAWYERDTVRMSFLLDQWFGQAVTECELERSHRS